MAQSAKFWIGIIFLVANQPLGILAIILCNAIALRQNNAVFTLIGLGAYALSWGMLGLGLLLAGPEGVAISRKWIKKARHSICHSAVNARRFFPGLSHRLKSDRRSRNRHE